MFSLLLRGLKELLKDLTYKHNLERILLAFEWVYVYNCSIFVFFLTGLDPAKALECKYTAIKVKSLFTSFSIKLLKYFKYGVKI